LQPFKTIENYNQLSLACFCHIGCCILAALKTDFWDKKARKLEKNNQKKAQSWQKRK